MRDILRAVAILCCVVLSMASRATEFDELNAAIKQRLASTCLAAPAATADFQELATAAGLPLSTLCVVPDMPAVAVALIDGTVLLDHTWLQTHSREALRFVLAHELGHATAGDSAARVRLLRKATGKPLNSLEELDLVVDSLSHEVIVRLSEMSISSEYRADRFAIRLTGVSAYILKDLLHGHSASLTHPSGQNRIAAVFAASSY